MGFTTKEFWPKRSIWPAACRSIPLPFAKGWLGWGTLGFLVLFLIPIVLPKTKLPAVLFCGCFLLYGAFIFRWLSQQAAISVTTLLAFAFGDCALLTCFALVGALKQGSLQKLIADLGFLIAYALLWRRLRISH